MKNKIQSGEGWKNLLADALMLIPMLRDACRGRYKYLPKWCIALPILAVLYVLSPVDIVPDLLPVLGQIDDGGIVFLCFRMLEPEIARYRRWREENRSTINIGVEK